MICKVFVFLFFLRNEIKIASFWRFLIGVSPWQYQMIFKPYFDNAQR